MRINLASNGARVIGSGRPWITLRVIAGSVRLARAQTDLERGEGLPVAVADGIVSLAWMGGEVWAVADTAPADLEIIS